MEGTIPSLDAFVETIRAIVSAEKSIFFLLVIMNPIIDRIMNVSL